jgi:hypothetical protein
VLPQKNIVEALAEGHGALFTAHDGVAKTKYRIMQKTVGLS